MLSPHDILYALNTLAAVRYDDVRSDIIAGLLELLQVFRGPTVSYYSVRYGLLN